MKKENESGTAGGEDAAMPEEHNEVFYYAPEWTRKWFADAGML